MPQVSAELVEDLERPKYSRNECQAQRKNSVDRIVLKTLFVIITTLQVFSTFRVCCIVCLVFEVPFSSEVFTGSYIVENNGTVWDERKEQPSEDCGE